MLLGLMFTLPDTRFGRNATSQPGQTRDSPNVSGRKRSSNVGLATYGWQPTPVREPAGLTAPKGLRLAAAPRLPSRLGCLCSAAMPHAAPSRDIVVVHSSDLHIDHDYTARLHGGDGTAGLSGVLSAARAAGADVVVLADRVPIDLLERAAAVISAAALPVVLLPGNHDPVVPDAVYHNGALAAVKNLHVLGVTHEEAVVFADLGLEIWGRPHRDYGDMIPFERLRRRSTRWQIAVAHGHY